MASGKAAEAPETKRVKVIETGEIDPRELVIDEAANGRRYATKIDEMAQSLLANGQEQPIRLRRESGKMHVVFGFRRARGGLYLIENKLDPKFMLRYELADMTAAEAFISNLVENKDREDPSPIEDAHNYLRLLGEPYNLSQREVAKRLKVSEPLVSRMLTLVRGSGENPPLSAKIQKLVHTRKIALEVAYDMVGMTEEERNKLVDKVVLGGKVSTSDARQASKKKRKKAGDGEHRAPSAKAIRLPFEEVVTKHGDAKPTPYVMICDVLVQMCKGAVSAKTALRKIRDIAA